jgi:PhnB protein
VAKPIPEGYYTFTTYLAVDDAASAIDDHARAFGAKERGRMDAPGDRFGTVTDPFGYVWSAAMHIEDVPPEEMAERARAAIGSN